MGDFHQNGLVTTLHNLTDRPVEDLERELLQFSKQRPMTLVLPCLHSELAGPALENIVDELCKVPYLEEIVIGLDAASKEDYIEALHYFSRLPQRHRVLWNDGPRLMAIDEKLRDQGLAPAEKGKGRNVWYMLGYVLASGRAESVALHDCDIVTYDRKLLARLIYPVANPNFSYAFCKGYYARIATDNMGGRVSRLFVTPLLRSLTKVCGYSEFLNYMDSFRYPLAGEFSLRSYVIDDLLIPSDWGLEVGVLSEMNRNYATNRICQVDIAENYDHKHQDLSKEDPTQGLSKMSTDIAKAMFRKLATKGQVFSPETFRTLKATYYRVALDFIDTYANDAVINGLEYHRHKEEEAVEMFAQNIMLAGEHFLERPMQKPFIPGWNRVASAIPDVLTDIRNAVEEDLREHTPGG